MGCSACEREDVLARGLCGKCYQRVRWAERPKRPCECGCGGLTGGPRFISGHNTRLLPRKEQRRRGRQNDGSTQRDRGEGKSYRKVRGRHEHRIVAEKKIGRKLRKGEVVHHINGKIRDNRPENLVVVTRAAHALHHFHKMEIK